jgi:hypothetical protein
MPRGLRAAVFAVSALLWVSGALWMLLHYLFPGHNEFGPLPNSYEAPLLRVHGLIAVAAVFLLGWLGASHMLARWSAWAGRPSGLCLLAAALVLILSGYALYYTTGGLHAAAAVVHEWLGLGALAIALGHWLGRQARGRPPQRPAESTTSSGSLTK